jgi:tetratricopeptide (TPR) repeat protein
MTAPACRIATQSHARHHARWFCLFWFILASFASSAQNAPPPMRGGVSALDEARSLVRDGKPREAEVAVRRYLSEGTDGEEARSLLGLILYQEDRPADSLAEFTRAARFATPTSSELIVVALDYVLLKDLPKADKWMTAAVEKQPENAAAWRYIGGIKYSENRFSEAIESYKKSLALHPGDVLVQDGIGRSLEGLSRDDDAISAYKEALRWQSGSPQKHPEPMLHLGALLLRKGEVPSALSLLLSAEQLSPNDAAIREQLGNAWMQSGNLAKAQKEVETALSLSPRNSHLHWLLASIYRKEGLTEQANRELKQYSALLGAHSSDKLQ